MSGILAALRERWTIARCVRTVRKSASAPAKHDSSAALNRLIRMNSDRSIAAIRELESNEATAPRTRHFAPSFGESDIPVIADMLRARRLPFSVRSNLIHSLAFRYAVVPEVTTVLEELAGTGQPEREHLVQSLIVSARTNYGCLPSREASIRLLVRVAHEVPEVRQLLADVPAHNDCQRQPLEALSRELVRDRSQPRELREAVFTRLCWLLSNVELVAVLEVLLADPDERLSLLALERAADHQRPLSTAALDCVAARLKHFDPPVRVAAAKALARGGDRRGVEHILAMQKPTLQTLRALGSFADGRCAQHAWRIHSQSRDRSALAFVEECLARDPAGVSMEVLNGIVKLPRQVTETTTHVFEPLTGEDLRNWYHMHENSPWIAAPTEATSHTETRVVEDNSRLVDLAQAELNKRGSGLARGRNRGRR